MGSTTSALKFYGIEHMFGLGNGCVLEPTYRTYQMHNTTNFQAKFRMIVA